MQEIRSATPGLRKKMIVIVIIGVLISGLLIWYLPTQQARYEVWLLSDPQQLHTKLQLVLLVFTVLLLPLLALAIYLWWIASLILSSGMFPPPQMAVIKDTPIVRGVAAIRRAWALRVTALSLLLAVLGLPLSLWYLIQLIDVS